MARLAWIAAVLGLVGCGGGGGDAMDASAHEAGMDSGGLDAGGQDGGGGDAPCADADGDGHAAISCGGDDCDDTDATRYPSNPESCDATGHDEDCNPATLGPDADHDGQPATTCCNTSAAGMLVCGTDCDDTEANIHAGAPESCNGVDDNCNGAVDEGLGTAYFPDCDGDTYGDMTGSGGPTCSLSPPTVVSATCVSGEPGLWATRGGDCNDHGAAVHPLAIESCNSVDDDCNGTVDDAAAVTTWCNDAARAYPHSTMSCTAGHCAFATCAAPYLDCDAAPGCEVAGDTDAANCGACAHACFHPTCSAGVCGRDFVQLDVGHTTTCGVRASGVVACWSYAAPLVADASGVTDAVQVSVGEGSEFVPWCARLRSGQIDCGAGPLPGITDATDLSVSTTHACAVHAGGHVACWGHNADGQLGDGSGTTQPNPVEAMGITDAVEVAVGSTEGADSYMGCSCARRVSGAVSCWGRCPGTGAINSIFPVDTGLTDATHLAASYDSACATTTSGSLMCWGYADHPHAVSAPVMDATDLSVWAGLVCMSHTTGVPTCGSYYSGVSSIPVVTGPTDVVQIETGGYEYRVSTETCLLRRTGEVDCVGYTSSLAPIMDP